MSDLLHMSVAISAAYLSIICASTAYVILRHPLRVSKERRELAKLARWFAAAKGGNA